ncbi:MAG: calcium/proton exchanger [Candidatus Reconcilbacillus cellulovorans]|uniref:Ca(2+)/H(+) antiporter n=1 Tax=Candidatus Reconcilbacillus cellulovorans TaxID=1906605 RepID=A0A2A6E4I9_9BACL|nr:MAG: calcium/proton exchanger [Candidatus Reconcilbacillus cellulovorans]
MSRKFAVSLVATFAAAAVGHYTHADAAVRFALACIAVLFAAAFLGRATESVAVYAGQRVGGFLNATFGNAAELIIALFLVKSGFHSVVKASLTGSVIGNLLLVLGLSVLLGGLRHRVQRFNPVLAGHTVSLMMLALLCLLLPAFFADRLAAREQAVFSLVVAAVMLAAYVCWLWFSMVTHQKELEEQTESADHGHTAPWSKTQSIVFLLAATGMIAFISEWLVNALETFTERFGLSELFVGAFLIAIVGNAAEHSAAVWLAMKNKLGAAVEIAIGSSLQIALFVSPVLVFASFLFGRPMDLIFDPAELTAIGVAVFIAASVARDGRTDWFEGVLLLALYVALGTAFFFL